MEELPSLLTYGRQPALTDDPRPRPMTQTVLRWWKELRSGGRNPMSSDHGASVQSMTTRCLAPGTTLHFPFSPLPISFLPRRFTFRPSFSSCPL